MLNLTGQAGIWLIFQGLFFSPTRLLAKRATYGWTPGKYGCLIGTDLLRVQSIPDAKQIDNKKMSGPHPEEPL